MKSKTCTLYVVRHGLSEYNHAGLIGGQTDPALMPEGRRQAEQARQTLAHIKFDAVYSSPLQRARDTVEIISGKKVPKAHLLHDLRERYFGELEGKHYSHGEGMHEAQLSLPADDRWLYAHVESMETDHALSERYIKALTEIALDNLDKTVLVGSHGSALRILLIKLGWARHEQLGPGSFKNTGYVKLTYQDGRGLAVQKVVGAERTPA